MADTVDKDKFDAVLRRLIASKPMTEQEIRDKALDERLTKKAAKVKRKDSD